ncbi:MAG: acetoacetate decarboxylase family protein [bacterium]|nr:acetoacetate decarboxylase family protein [bacterium]
MGSVAAEGTLTSAVRSIRCIYETDAEVAQAVVPKPLEACVQPEMYLSFASVAMQVSPDVTLEIRSASFGVRVDYDDKPGYYLITMPMSSEAAVVGGRERFGEPKKLAEIEFDGSGGAGGEAVSASVERMGIRYLAAIGNRVEDLGAREQTEYGYCFKAFPSCDANKGFDQDPQLVRLEWRHRFDRVWRLEGGIELWDSPFDPVADLPMRRLVEFEYTEGTTASSGRVLRPVPGDWLLPFIHQRYDEPQTEGVEV